MTDALEEAFAYLGQVPTGTARVTLEQAKKAFRGRSVPVHVAAKEWAEMHGFVMTADRPEMAVARTFYFKVKS